MKPTLDGMREVELRGGVIRLGQLLKLVDAAESGAEAKLLLADGQVTVNGEIEQRRGRQIRPGDVVVAAGQEIRAS